MGDNLMKKSFRLSAVLMSSLAIWVSACGSAIPATVDAPSDNNATAAPSSEAGIAGFGIQCPYGYVEDPTPTQVSLVTIDANGYYQDCPNTQITLSQPLESIILSADCKGKNLSARTSDRSVDNTFEAKPDGSFYLQMPAGYAQLNNGCQIPVTASLSGQMTCGSLTANNYDQVDIAVDSVWTPTPAPSSSPSSLPAAPAAGCSIPAGCMLHAFTTVHQCKQ
ncbi:unnamed protein product [Sphagnum jensenii]|uniref:Uncharacterized protein n=1 Tax=Sphagnum jensenii TaxID=128206 RepID=A0ABP0V5Z1_9BRYO